VLASTDFLAVEVLTLRGLVTYYVLIFIHLESRRVDIAGLTVHERAMDAVTVGYSNPDVPMVKPTQVLPDQNPFSIRFSNTV
jgi:hypothetical protein